MPEYETRGCRGRGKVLEIGRNRTPSNMALDCQFKFSEISELKSNVQHDAENKCCGKVQET